MSQDYLIKTSLKASSLKTAKIQESTEPQYKFEEDVILQKALEHIRSTYNQHYVNKNQDQTLDYIMQVCDSTDFLKGNAIKYLSRFGRKEGLNDKDLLKAIHYVVLLYYFSLMK